MRETPLSPSAKGSESIDKEPRPTRLIVVMSGASMAYEINPERRLDPEWKEGPKTNRNKPAEDGGHIEWKFPLILPNQGPIVPGNERGTRRDISGGWARMLALSKVFTEEQSHNGSAKILVTGGLENDTDEHGEKIQKSRADEAARVLSARYHIPENAVESIGGPGSTLGNSAAASQYIEKHPEFEHVTELEAVTNDYHMLRTWIMFSAGFLRATAGKELVVEDSDKKSVEDILKQASLEVDQHDWTGARIHETRNAVMNVLQKYFNDSKIKVVPLVAEEVIEKDGSPAEKDYANRLRNHPRVRDMLKREYQGIQDLLNGNYKGKL